MSYGGVQMFMEKLKQLMYCDDIPVINYNPFILCVRPQFRLLSEELYSTIQTLFNHEDQDLHNFEGVRKLKKRFKAASEEAEDIVDIFLSAVHCRNNGYFLRSDVFQPSLQLDVVMQSLNSIKMEFMSISTGNMQMDSSQIPDKDRLQIHSAGTSRGRRSLISKKKPEEMVVGLGRDVELIRYKVVEDGKHLDVVSIVGMGGLGKTTLANKVFNDPFVVHHFYVRGWVTISQTYDKRDILIQVLSSIKEDKRSELEIATDSQLREMLHKSLIYKRYLIVIDDIWSIEAWDKLKLFFPDHNNGSRILLTSRLTEVASHAKSNGFVHRLQHLTDEESWELLRGEVFKGNHECPEWLIEPGKQIAKNCHGLPLSVVVMAGVLANEPRNEDVWIKISQSESVRSYIASDEKGCLETIALSYHHLPHHLRDCFLYFGGFPEDVRLSSRNLLPFWMAEGFIQEDGNRSSEEIAMSYLIDLVDRNLVIVETRYASGEVGGCKVHDLVRQLCVEKGKEERFFLKLDSPPSNYLFEEVITTHKQRRVFTNQEIDILSLSHLATTPSIRSLLCYHRKTTLRHNSFTEFLRSFALIRVLDLQKCNLIEFSPILQLLVHLRYLEICVSSLCNLWNLQSLYIYTTSSCITLPSNISDLVNLRFLVSSNADLYLPSIGKPMKLEVITNVKLGDGVDNFKKCFPGINDLTTTLYSNEENDFEGLHYLEILTLIGSGSCRRESAEPKFEPNLGKNYVIRFPATLKQLTLKRCRLPWSNMSNIQSLPNLEVLTLYSNAFDGTLWEIGEEPFPQLKFLRLKKLNIKQWEASSINFPCLQQLQVLNCFHLEEIPLELGETSTLEEIYIKNCGASLLESLKKNTTGAR